MVKNVISKWALKQLPDGFIPDIASILNEAEKGEWLPCKNFPAQVQDVLMQHGNINEPWIRGRAEQYKWVAEKQWLYKTEFIDVTPNSTSFLHFNGLDTLCDIFLNGEKILSANDCYIPWEIEVTGMLKEKNDLLVYFPSVIEYLNNAKIPDEWDGRFPKHRLLRRPESDSGPYLGPNPSFIRVGIYGEVTFIQYPQHTAIREVRMSASLNENFSIGTVKYWISGISEQNTTLHINITYNDAHIAGVSVNINSMGDFTTSGKITVDTPDLWWPRGHGKQTLYNVIVTIGDNPPIDSTIRRIGFRRIDSPEPYRFIINGRKIVLMGGNFAPLDCTTYCWDKNRMNRLFDLAENANFNIMRMWGCTGPTDDHFYDECDARGILLWRDFNNGSRNIPEDDVNVAHVLREVEYHVTHQMHRPCILVWCGGNENYLWANRKSPNDPDFMGYQTIQKMKEVCHKLDPERYFVESSPSLGDFPNDPRGGNTHGYTNMWFIPGYDYIRFASEDTRISAPCLKSVERFMRPEDIWPDDYSPIYKHGDTLPWPKSWMFYTSSTSERKVGPIEEFYDADNPYELIYKIGSANGIYYKRTIEKFRQGRPSDSPGTLRNASGYIVWKFNDSWPQIYSAKVDYFLEPYISYYYIRRAYSPLQVSFDIGAYIYAWVANDTKNDFRGLIKIYLFDMVLNKFVAQTQRLVSVNAGDSSSIVRLDEFTQFDRKLALFAELYDTRNDIVATACDFAEIERRLTFPDAKIALSYKGSDLIVETDKFARCIELTGEKDGEKFGFVFSDNFFDLLPGQIKKVQLLFNKPGVTIIAKAHYSPHKTTIVG